MNTFIRLSVLIPATVFAFFMAWVGIGFAGLSFWPLAFHAGLVAIPLALVVWTIRDHFARKSMANLGERKR